MYLIVNRDGQRLCQDKCWRGHANFGTYLECVREYKSLAAARQRAKKVGGQLLRVPDGYSVNAAGAVFRGGPDGAEYVCVAENPFVLAVNDAGEPVVYVLELVGAPRRLFVESFSNSDATVRPVFSRYQAKVFGTVAEAEGWAKQYATAHTWKVVPQFEGFEG